MAKNRPVLQSGGLVRNYRSNLKIFKKQKTWRNAYYNCMQMQRGGGRQRGGNIFKKIAHDIKRAKWQAVNGNRVDKYGQRCDYDINRRCEM